MADVLMTFFQNHPSLLCIITAMTVIKAVMKPLFTILHSVASAVGSTKLDQEVTTIEGSKVVYWITYIIDWATSIKLGPQVAVAALPPGTVVAVQALKTKVANAVIPPETTATTTKS